MRNRAIIIVLAGVAVLVIAIGMAFKPSRARCTWCYSGQCWDSGICGQGCLCLKRGLDVSGYCYGVN